MSCWSHFDSFILLLTVFPSGIQNTLDKKPWSDCDSIIEWICLHLVCAQICSCMKNTLLDPLTGWGLQTALGFQLWDQCRPPRIIYKAPHKWGPLEKVKKLFFNIVPLSSLCSLLLQLPWNLKYFVHASKYENFQASILHLTYHPCGCLVLD